MSTASLYQPLDASQEEIRLCFLHPSTNNNDNIECDIYNIPLCEATGNYIALSYVWGDPNITESISINGIQWPVTTNLASALRNIRHRAWSDMVWADAICIDQANIAERNNQVALMRKIYQDAREVLAWLGDIDNESEAALEWINKIPHLRDEGEKKYGQFMEENGDFAALLEWDLWMWLRFVPELRRPNVWMAIRGLLRLVIWTRVWIFQELVLAKRVFFLSWNQTAQIESFEKLDELLSSQYLRSHDIVDSDTSFQLSTLAAELQLIFAVIFSRRQELHGDFSGKDSTSGSRVSASPTLNNPTISSTALAVESISLSLQSEVSGPLPLSADPDPAEASAQPSKIQQPIDSILEITSSPGHQKNVETSKANTHSSLFTLLTYTQHLKASDPRDKIYGLLAFTEGLSADYSKTIRDVYVGFAESYISSVGNLHVLTEAGIGIQVNLINTVPDLPSWVPDWHAISQYVQADKTDDKSKFTVYEASKGRKAAPAFGQISGSTALLAQGVICDKIRVVAQLAPEMIVTFRRSKAAEIIAERYLTGIPKLLALCAVLMERRPLEDEVGLQNGLSDIEAGFLNSLTATSDNHHEPNSMDQELELSPRAARALLLSYMDKIISRAEGQLPGPEHPVKEASQELEDESASRPLIELSGNLPEGPNQVPSTEESAGDPAKGPKTEVTRENPEGVLYGGSAGGGARIPSQDPDYICAFSQFLADCSDIIHISPRPLDKNSILSLFLGEEELAKRLERSRLQPPRAPPGEDESELDRGYRCEPLYISREESSIRNRSFVETEQGLYGLGPVGAKEGDHVCVLFGLDYPVVLRRVRAHYVLVGPCYVLGLMNGEAIEAIEEGNATALDFEIW
jgi:Heterokaryon incompatibility protein (HET)